MSGKEVKDEEWKEVRVKEETERKSEKPSWIKMKKEELEKLVVQMAKGGKITAKIGLELRDKYGIPRTRLFGRSVCEILDEHNIGYEKEEKIITKSVENLRKHIEKNKKDYPASRALTKKLWAIRKLAGE